MSSRYIGWRVVVIGILSALQLGLWSKHPTQGFFGFTSGASLVLFAYAVLAFGEALKREDRARKVQSCDTCCPECNADPGFEDHLEICTRMCDDCLLILNKCECDR